MLIPGNSIQAHLQTACCSYVLIIYSLPVFFVVSIFHLPSAVFSYYLQTPNKPWYCLRSSFHWGKIALVTPLAASSTSMWRSLVRLQMLHHRVETLDDLERQHQLGFKHEFYFPFQIWDPISFPLTFTPSFFRGVG